ncbi:hypothetical protein AX767_06030 [Variovorax sp. PAMC 28711]|nr:hypothetical protein AX767_06030 [Variovorax sp. PAMC 28711]
MVNGGMFVDGAGRTAEAAADRPFDAVPQNYLPMSHYIAILIVSIASAAALVLAAPADASSTAWELPPFGGATK